MQLSPEQVQSVNILLSAVQVAQRRGAFSLQDASTLQEAIDRLVPREEQEKQAAAAAEEVASDDQESLSLSEESLSEDELADSEPALGSE